MRFLRPARGLALMLTVALAFSPAAHALTVQEGRDLLEQNYIDAIPEEILNLPTIEEITAALGDPYTYYMTAEEYRDFSDSLNDTNVIGIGAMVEITADGLIISAVAPDAPAAKGELKAGDVIVGVEGKSLAEIGSSELMSKLIPGKAGTPVKLTILRDGKTFDISMIRAAVVFPTVIGEVVDGHIGWLDCTSFGETTGDYFETYITEEDPVADRWVVDLRGNPGGYAVAVIQAAGHVLGNRDISYIVDNKMGVGTWRPNIFQPDSVGLIDEPLIVMVDNRSASAAELFAAAMRDYRHALIIGTRTFGKGIAQNVFPQEDGSVFKITTNRYYSPLHVTPDHSGVLPTLVVDPKLAPNVATLLSGKTAEQASPDVLVLKLVDKQWFVHKDTATGTAHKAAFTELLKALPPETPMTLNGKAVTAAEAAKAWGAEYTARIFTDVAGTPYEESINTMSTLELLAGADDGTFNPNGQITRAELCEMLVTAMGYWSWASQGRAPFADVTEKDAYDTAVTITYRLGLILGENENFNPQGIVDYQQFLTILTRVAAWSDLTIAGALTRDLKPEALARPEVASYSPWAQQYVLIAEEAGFLSKPLKELSPTGAITRAEAADMLLRFMEYSGIISTLNVEKK